jgi:hypothetical protein
MRTNVDFNLRLLVPAALLLSCSRTYTTGVYSPEGVCDEFMHSAAWKEGDFDFRPEEVVARWRESYPRYVDWRFTIDQQYSTMEIEVEAAGEVQTIWWEDKEGCAALGPLMMVPVDFHFNMDAGFIQASGPALLSASGLAPDQLGIASPGYVGGYGHWETEPSEEAMALIDERGWGYEGDGTSHVRLDLRHELNNWSISLTMFYEDSNSIGAWTLWAGTGTPTEPEVEEEDWTF